jgi:perosamine synthetase
MGYIPFFKAFLTGEELRNVARVLKSGWLTTGAETRAFEREFVRSQGVTNAVAVNSCTAGLHLSLLACGIGRGDTVITTPFTFASTANVILHAGAEVRFVDVNEDDFTINCEQAEQAASGQVKAVIPVHYAGAVCDMGALKRLRRKKGVRIIQDSAHCVEGLWKGRSPASCGDISCYSFYATKNITTGEGGMVATDDSRLADKIRLMSLHGLSRDAWARYQKGAHVFYKVLLPGYKYNLSDIQSAIGRAQLRKVRMMSIKRKALDALYREQLGDVDGIRFQQVRPGSRHAHHLFVVDLDTRRSRIRRQALMDIFQRRGIGFSVHFVSLHLHPYYRKRYGFRPEDFPVSARLSREIISLPFFPGMNERQVRRVAGAFRDAYRK